MDQTLGLFLYGMSLPHHGWHLRHPGIGFERAMGLRRAFQCRVSPGFAAVGAYTYAILTTADSPFHYGGLGPAAGRRRSSSAMALSGVIAAVIGAICIRLQGGLPGDRDHRDRGNHQTGDLKNETEITNGPRGINKIPRTWEHLTEERFYSTWPMSMVRHAGRLGRPSSTALPAWWWQPFFAGDRSWWWYSSSISLLERARLSPWGRMMAAIRDNEIGRARRRQGRHRPPYRGLHSGRSHHGDGRRACWRQHLRSDRADQHL